MISSKITDLLKEDTILNLNILGRMKFEGDFNLKLSGCGNAVLYQSGYWTVVYARDDMSAKKMIAEINNKEEKGFAGVGEKYYQIAKEIFPIKWEEFCHLYYLEEESLDLTLKSHEVDSLNLSDAGIVNEFYTYKEDGSLEYIKKCIEKRPTSVIRDENGNPISWAVIREDGSLGIMYTLKEHRGKGYAVSVSVDLAKKAFNLGITPYVHIVRSNTPSINLAKTLGFKYHCDIVWFGI